MREDYLADNEAKRVAWKEKFIAEFPKYRTITYTAKAIGVTRMSINNWMRQDPEFKLAFEDAKVATLDYYLNILDDKLDNDSKVNVAQSNLIMFRVKQLDPSFRDNFTVVVETGDKLKTLLEAYTKALGS